MRATRVCVVALLAVHAWAIGLRRGPDDHFVHEAVEHAGHAKDAAPETPLEKDFIALDRNGDKTLDAAELTFRQYASGCDPIEARIRAQDYMRCGDSDHNGGISLQEFEASADPEWAECVRASRDRRAHTFYRFFEADNNYDGKVDETELRAEILRMWGTAGEELVEPLMVCTDKNKNLHIEQDEFHSSLAAYNPATRTWQLLYHDGDASVLPCLDAAMKAFDLRLAFEATDANKDGKISKQESYDTLGQISPSMDHATADKLFVDSDTSKDGFLDLEEFKASGTSHKPAASFLLTKTRLGAPASGSAALGMGAVCAARPVPTYSLWLEDAAAEAAHERKVQQAGH